MDAPDWKTCTEEKFWKYVAWHLKARGIETVLVGGGVVAIYTAGIYRSGDIDLVPNDLHRIKIPAVLKEIGFQRVGRHFKHGHCEHIFVEFPSGPVSLGDDYNIEPAEMEVDGLFLKLLSPTDCVKDRLASFIHWKVRDCFDQAVLVAREQKVNLSQIEEWCINEGSPKTYREFDAALNRS